MTADRQSFVWEMHKFTERKHILHIFSITFKSKMYSFYSIKNTEQIKKEYFHHLFYCFLIVPLTDASIFKKVLYFEEVRFPLS